MEVCSGEPIGVARKRTAQEDAKRGGGGEGTLANSRAVRSLMASRSLPYAQILRNIYSHSNSRRTRSKRLTTSEE